MQPDGTTSTVTADPTTGAYTVESPTVQTNGNITATATDVNGNTKVHNNSSICRYTSTSCTKH